VWNGSKQARGCERNVLLLFCLEAPISCELTFHLQILAKPCPPGGAPGPGVMGPVGVSPGGITISKVLSEPGDVVLPALILRT
jgi:hypothetical protein